MMRSQIEIDQRLDWLCMQFEKLKQRLEDLERSRLTVAVSPCKCEFDTAIRQPTGETL